MKIDVLDGGHGAHAAAAHLGDAGHEVRLRRRQAAALVRLFTWRSVAPKS